MVGEDEVAAATLHVDGGSQVRAGDRRALDVPAGTAAAQHGVPGGLAGSLRLPDQAVERVLLAGSVGVSATVGEDGHHLLAGPAGDLAESRVPGDREVEVRPARARRRNLVDASGRLQVLDHLHHERDRLDGAHVGVRREHAERLHVLAEQGGLALGEGLPVLPRRVGALEQRVVDVGDVLHVADLVAGGAPGPVEQVEGDVRRGVAQVGRVVRRDAADVHPGSAVGGHHLAHTLRGGVEDPHLGSAHTGGKGSAPAVG